MVKLVKLFPLTISRPFSETMKCILSYAKWGTISVENALSEDLRHDG